MGSAQRRVVITGMGLVSPVGDTPDALWEALSTGRSGVGPLTVVPADAFPTSIAAEADGFAGKIDDFGPLDKEKKKAIRKGLKVMCRECQMGVAVAQRAFENSGLPSAEYDPERIGISYGSDYMVTEAEEFIAAILSCVDTEGQFVFSRWGIDGMPQMSPLWLLKYLPNMPASHLAIYNDLRGPNNSLTLREASAGAVIGEAFQVIAGGRADAMLVGSTGTRLHPLKMVHAAQLEELATEVDDPARACRPFERDRTGMVLGEGAAAVVLEAQSSAEARGAKIWAEVLGGVSVAAVGPKMEARREAAMTHAMVSALRIAGLSPDGIGHVQAHGLSTRSCDIAEAQAIRRVFGDRARPVPVTAAKSYFGNLGAGSGMVELLAGVLALTHDRLFPVMNYGVPDPACPIAAVREYDRKPGDSFIQLSVTPQGQASAAVVRRYGG